MHDTASPSVSSTRVVHVKDNVPGAVYIGREYRRRGYDLLESPLRNPFPIEKGHPRWVVIMDYRVMAECRLRLARRGVDIGIAFVEALIAARNKPLACWCRHDGQTRTKSTMCHGDVIIDLLEQYTDDELRDMTRAKAA